jgi:hypothetical protein
VMRTANAVAKCLRHELNFGLFSPSD